MQPAIEVDKLSIALGDTEVLKDFSISIPAGKVIGLLGPSGAGKTTLIRAIIGRLKINSGKINVLDLPAGSPSLRKEIGYVTQSPSVYRDLTVKENSRYFAKMLSLPEEQAQAAIQRVGLSKYAGQLVGTLSGGQLSRVSLAVALLGNPRLLLLDEPTVGVDPVLRRDLWRQFHELAKQGVTLLISSHVMDEAGYCDYLLLVRDGELLAFGSLDELAEKTGTRNVEDIFLKSIGEEA
jgi:ABC-2 type transport system ATP-binding protein